MAQQLKRWESPRRQGRNHKGRGGTARQRQYRKQQQRLRQRLKPGRNDDSLTRRGEGAPSPFLVLLF